MREVAFNENAESEGRSGFFSELRNIGDSFKTGAPPGEGAFVRVLDVRALTSRGTVFLVRY